MKWTLAIISVLFILPGCHDEKDPATAQPPTLSVTPINLEGPYDSSDSTFGEIKMVDPVIIPFGGLDNSSHQSPAIEYYTRLNTAVLAGTTGVVERLDEDPYFPGEYEIRITALPGSDYTIIYGYVTDPHVLEGSAISPGDTLGLSGPWTDRADRVALQVNYGFEANERAYCPLRYGDSLFVERHQELLDEYNRRGFSPSYDSLCLEGSIQP